MSNLDVQFFSFGQKWGIYPNGPDAETLQFIVDVRAFIPDPVSNFPIFTNGTSHLVVDWMCEQHGDVLRNIRHQVLGLVEAAIKGDYYRHIKIFFMCTGGYQRSVAIAEWMAGELNNCPNAIIILPTIHLTLSLADSFKRTG